MGATEDIKEAITNSAVNLFEKYGYKNVRINQITNNIGMTTGAFYYYFTSKEEILQMIYENYINMVVDMMNEIYKMQDVSPNDKLYLFIKRHTKLIQENHSFVSVYFRENRNLSESGLELVRKKNSQVLQYCVQLIEDGIKEGVFRNLNPKILSLAILGMNNWLYQWYQQDGDLTVEEIADIFFELITGGLSKNV